MFHNPLYRSLTALLALALLAGACALPAPAPDVQAAPLAAAPEMSPEQVVLEFYTGYIAYARPDPQSGLLHNPLVSGAYRDMPYLSPDFVARVDDLIASGPLVADPFLCAQDVPESVVAGTPDLSPDGVQADVLVTTSFAGHSFLAHLERGAEGWLIAGVSCGR